MNLLIRLFKQWNCWNIRLYDRKCKTEPKPTPNMIHIVLLKVYDPFERHINVIMYFNIMCNTICVWMSSFYMVFKYNMYLDCVQLNSYSGIY